jgi:NitT/TauT family transport system permease protein
MRGKESIMTTVSNAAPGTLVRLPEAVTESALARRAKRHPKLERWALRGIALALLLALWQVVASLFVTNDLLMPTVPETVRAAWTLYVSDHSIYGDLAVTAKEWGIGFAISLSAIPIGLLVGSSRRFRTATQPITAALYTMPHIALIPLGIVWFGLGLSSKIFIVFISVFFMLMINIMAGVESLDAEFRNVARAFGISKFRTFFTVTVPGSLPFIASGLQLGVGKALTAVVAAELFAANQGYGFLLSIYGNEFRTADLFVIIASLAFAGVLLTELMNLITARLAKWRVTET